MFEYQAQVVKVIDGDTVDLLCDLGFHVRIAIRTRLLGIDAPELGTPAGKAARDWLTAELTGACTVRTFRVPGDKYGRWLAVITHPVLGDVAAALMAKGHAAGYAR